MSTVLKKITIFLFSDCISALALSVGHYPRNVINLRCFKYVRHVRVSILKKVVEFPGKDAPYVWLVSRSRGN